VTIRNKLGISRIATIEL